MCQSMGVSRLGSVTALDAWLIGILALRHCRASVELYPGVSGSAHGCTFSS